MHRSPRLPPTHPPTYCHHYHLPTHLLPTAAPPISTLTLLRSTLPATIITTAPHRPHIYCHADLRCLHHDHVPHQLAEMQHELARGQHRIKEFNSTFDIADALWEGGGRRAGGGMGVSVQLRRCYSGPVRWVGMGCVCGRYDGRGDRCPSIVLAYAPARR